MDALTADLTVSQKILLAAHKLEDAGHSPFTIEALTVQAWKANKVTFGLKGFADEYPNSNVIYAALMGERGLAKRGWLVKVGPKLYNLSRQGNEEARRILEGDDSPLPKRRALAAIRVPKDLEQQLVCLFTTTAFRRYEEGMKREITYRDACQFWSLSDSATGSYVDAVLAQTPATLAAVEQLLIGDSIDLSNGQSVNTADLKALGGVHRWMTEQFARNLNQQRERGGRAFRRLD
jgi:hypothetical protein